MTGPSFAEAFLAPSTTSSSATLISPPTRSSTPPLDSSVPPQPGEESTPPLPSQIPQPPAENKPIERESIQTLLPTFKVIFPTGRPRPTTVFNGKITNAWFDIHTFSDRTVGESSSIEGLHESILYLSQLIKEEVEELERAEKEDGEGREKGKVIIGGFSQGSAMAMILLLSGELDRIGVERERIGGWVGISGWLPFRLQIISSITPPTSIPPSPSLVQKRTEVRTYIRTLLSLPAFNPEPRLEAQEQQQKIWLGHGGLDAKVRTEWGEQMRCLLGGGEGEGERGLGYDVKGRVYEGVEHWWCEQEVRELCWWIKSTVDE
jgi:lysophospholipase-2